MIFRELSNGAFRFSLRRPGAEIMGGGGRSNAPPPPTRRWKIQRPSRARVNALETSFGRAITCYGKIYNITSMCSKDWTRYTPLTDVTWHSARASTDSRHSEGTLEQCSSRAGLTHGPMGRAVMGLDWAHNLEISTGSGRAWAEKFQIIWIGRESHLYS